MHEMSLASSIIEIVLEEVAATAAARKEGASADSVPAMPERTHQDPDRENGSGSDASRPDAAVSVSSVYFRAGRLHSILPDSLTFYYDQLKLDHEALRMSRLDIELIAERARCQLCHHEFEIDAPIFVCPQCSGPAVIIDGQEMYIERIEMGSEPAGTGGDTG